jgi:aminoglycoside 6'-N-acetyltransferase I
VADKQPESPIAIRQFFDLASAILARSVLDSSGIWCFLEGENAAGRSAGRASIIHPIRLIVRGEDAVVAESLLQGGTNESELSPNDDTLATADDVQVRRAVPADREILGKMRHELWPESSIAHHEEELGPILAGKSPGIMPMVYFVAEHTSGDVVGFVEVGLRSTADGCDWAQAVGYVEGWYVAESYRRCGVGAQLIAAAEDWAREQGCTEMASDTQIDNTQSLQAHLRLGYEIAERSILFRKSLR